MLTSQSSEGDLWVAMYLKDGYFDCRYLPQLKVLSASSGGVALQNVYDYWIIVIGSGGTITIPVTNNC